MTVAELISHLQNQPQDLTVAFRCYSEACLLETHEIEQVEFSEARADGWVHGPRKDKPTKTYLMFPGN